MIGLCYDLLVDTSNLPYILVDALSVDPMNVYAMNVYTMNVDALK